MKIKLFAMYTLFAILGLSFGSGITTSIMQFTGYYNEYFLIVFGTLFGFTIYKKLLELYDKMEVENVNE